MNTQRNLWRRALNVAMQVPAIGIDGMCLALNEPRKRVRGVIARLTGTGELESIRPTAPGVTGLYRITEKGMALRKGMRKPYTRFEPRNTPQAIEQTVVNASRINNVFALGGQ